MPSHAIVRLSLVLAFALTLLSAARGQTCGSYDLDDTCHSCPSGGVNLVWTAVGAPADPCANPVFTVTGHFIGGGECTDPRPLIEVSREAYPDCRWNLLIKSEDKFSGYTVIVHEPGVSFKHLRVLKASGEPDHNVELVLRG